MAKKDMRNKWVCFVSLVLLKACENFQDGKFVPYKIKEDCELYVESESLFGFSAYSSGGSLFLL